jgi:hypothetical protein
LLKRAGNIGGIPGFTAHDQKFGRAFGLLFELVEGFK